MYVSLMSSSPGAEHLRVAVLITTISSNFLISWMGKINIFHIVVMLTHVAKIFFAMGDNSITKLLWETPPHPLCNLCCDNNQTWLETGRFCGSHAAVKCGVQKISGKLPIYSHPFCWSMKTLSKSFSVLTL